MFFVDWPGILNYNESVLEIKFYNVLAFYDVYDNAMYDGLLLYVSTVYSLSGKPSYRQISRSLEAARLGVIIIASPLEN